MSYEICFPEIHDTVKNFRLPSYNEIPDVGLYLEQVSKYITECLTPLEQPGLTGSMISNYVKQKLIPSPVKKLYYRDQIAYLLFIAIAKNALSINQIKELIEKQQTIFEPEPTYNYFLSEFEAVFSYVFGLADEPAPVCCKSSDAPSAAVSENPDDEEFTKAVLRSLLLVFGYKVFLDKIIAHAGIRNERAK